MKICAWTIAYLLNCILFILSGSGFKKRAYVFAVFFMYVRIRNPIALKSPFCKTVWDIFENSMSKLFEEIRLKRLFNTSGNFDGVEFIIFTALKSIKDEFWEIGPAFFLSCALATRTVCEWSRCERKVFALKTVWKKRRNPWKSLKCIRWSKLLPFELWKISHALSGPCGGL